MSRAHFLAPTALGVGLRPAHYAYICDNEPVVDYVEAIADNFLSNAAGPRAWLHRVKQRYPVALHSVGLNLLGASPLDEGYLDRLCRLADTVNAPFVSDHLCWTGAHGVHHHDLLPLPYTEDLLAFAAERAAYVQRRLDRPFGLENLSSYVQFSRSTVTEAEFYAGVIEAAQCWAMLDINNVAVSSKNHGFDAHAYLAEIDFSRVLQVHLAGHEVLANGVRVDTHDRAVSDDVWNLYAHAWRVGGPFPTLVEWDANVPPFPVLLAEVAKAHQVRA